MDAITDIFAEALNKYFHSLSVLGYKNYSDVASIIILGYIEEILTGEMASYVEEKDFSILSTAINKLCGSNCLIKYKCVPTDDSLVLLLNKLFTPRITENVLLRSSEDAILRVKE